MRTIIAMLIMVPGVALAQTTQENILNCLDTLIGQEEIGNGLCQGLVDNVLEWNVDYDHERYGVAPTGEKVYEIRFKKDKAKVKGENIQPGDVFVIINVFFTFKYNTGLCVSHTGFVYEVHEDGSFTIVHQNINSSDRTRNGKIVTDVYSFDMMSGDNGSIAFYRPE